MFRETSRPRFIEPQLVSSSIGRQRASTGFMKSNTMAIARKCWSSEGKPACSRAMDSNYGELTRHWGGVCFPAPGPSSPGVHVRLREASARDASCRGFFFDPSLPGLYAVRAVW